MDEDASSTTETGPNSSVEAGVAVADAADFIDAGPERVIDWEAVEAVLAEIRAGERYQRPTPQDSEGRGIYPAQGTMDGRSERVLPPFIMGPRRQTDSMVRQLYALLPLETRRALAFVIPDRIAQDPDVYIPYLRSRDAIHVVGNFVGIGQASKDEPWFVARHNTELWMAKVTLKLAVALGLEVKSVRYTMGDSSSSYASSVRETLEARLHKELSALGLDALQSTLTFGADEAVPVALAAALPNLTIRIYYTKGDARHHYDGNKTSRQVIAPKLVELGLQEVSTPADLELWVLDNVTGDDGTLPSESAQRKLDQQAVATYEALDVSERRKLVIVDGRMFNGALDAYGAPHDCNMLAYGAWGTFANKVGTTLASAKILAHAGDPAAQRTLLLEAVAHDVFANGYRDGRDELTPRLSARGITFQHSAGYESPSEVETVFEVLNDFVASKLNTQISDDACLNPAGRVHFSPQLFRTFESEAHLLPSVSPAASVVGVFRTDLKPKTFDPRAASNALHMLTLADIVRE